MNRMTERSVALFLCLTVVFLAGCGGGGAGGENSSDESVAVELVVRWITPTNRQECLGDLSDPGLEGVITLNFSERLDPSTVLDPTNAFNGLTSDVNILNSGFYRVAGTPVIGGSIGNVLTFYPSAAILTNGQYTVTVTRDVKNFQGGQLNGGLFDFRSSFTVGTDIYKPVIRNTFPAPNQQDVPKTSQVIITFNESLNPSTVTGSTVTVMNGSANPPVPVSGTLATARDDFEIVFTPDPANPMPANSTISVTVFGGPNGVADTNGNTYEYDPLSPNYTFQFDTVKEPPPPNNPIPVDLQNGDALVCYATGTDVGTLAEFDYINNTYPDLSGWGTNNPIQYGQTRVGSPGELLFDPRFNPTDGHSWVYVIDRGSRSVTIFGTRDSKIVHRWRDLPDPRGLAIDPNGRALMVTNYSSDSVSFVDIGQVTVGTSAPTQQLRNLTKPYNPNDQSNGGTRRDVQVGRGPLGAAHAPDALLLFVANNIDNSCSLINTSTLAVNTTFPIGTSPQDVAATVFYIGVGRFAFITCLGGGSDDNGSVSLYWDRPNGLQANITGFKNPKGCIFDWGVSAWIANSGGNTASKLTLAFAGGSFAATILPQITNTVTVGNNPNGITIEPFGLFAVGTVLTVITADRGASQLTFIDAQLPSRPTFSLTIPGVQEVAAWLDQ